MDQIPMNKAKYVSIGKFVLNNCTDHVLILCQMSRTLGL